MNSPYAGLDSVFDAFAHQHRRDIVYALSLQPYAISQLATLLHLSLPAIHKHIKILELAGIVTRKKSGRITILTLHKKSLYGLQRWLMQFQAYWGNDNESLENYSQFVQKK